MREEAMLILTVLPQKCSDTHTHTSHSPRSSVCGKVNTPQRQGRAGEDRAHTHSSASPRAERRSTAAAPETLGHEMRGFFPAPLGQTQTMGWGQGREAQIAFLQRGRWCHRGRGRSAPQLDKQTSVRSGRECEAPRRGVTFLAAPRPSHSGGHFPAPLKGKPFPLTAERERDLQGAGRSAAVIRKGGWWQRVGEQGAKAGEQRLHLVQDKLMMHPPDCVFFFF